MTLDPRKILLRPRGRLGRTAYLLGVAALVIIAYGFTFGIRALDASTASGFWFGLAFILLYPFIVYSVYGQRLHDLGRSVWPLTGVILLMALVMTAVALAYGGDEYVYAYSEFSYKDAIDEQTKRGLDEAYESELATGGARMVNMLLGAIMGIFTLILAVLPGHPETNKYGPPPAKN